MTASQFGAASPASLSVDPDDDMRATSPTASGVRFWAALAVAGVAVAGFSGVVGYGYLAYSGRDGQGPVPVVRADPRPDKVKPEDPGGLAVPHQGVRVFDLAQRSGSETPPPAPRVERLLPPPEAPLPKPMPAPAPVQAAPTPPPAEAPATVAAAAQPVLISTPGPLPPPPRPGTAPLSPALASTSAGPSPVIPAAAAPAASSTARPTAGSGGYRVQVAALRSDEEARQAWSRLQRKHADVLAGMSATIARVELPGRGTFYRVQAGPWRDRTGAEDACARLVRGGTGCMIVPPS